MLCTCIYNRVDSNFKTTQTVIMKKTIIVLLLCAFSVIVFGDASPNPTPHDQSRFGLGSLLPNIRVNLGGFHGGNRQANQPRTTPPTTIIIQEIEEKPGYYQVNQPRDQPPTTIIIQEIEDKPGYYQPPPPSHEYSVAYVDYDYDVPQPQRPPMHQRPHHHHPHHRRPPPHHGRPFDIPPGHRPNHPQQPHNNQPRPDYSDVPPGHRPNHPQHPHDNQPRPNYPQEPQNVHPPPPNIIDNHHTRETSMCPDRVPSGPKPMGPEYQPVHPTGGKPPPPIGNDDKYLTEPTYINLLTTEDDIDYNPQWGIKRTPPPYVNQDSLDPITNKPLPNYVHEGNLDPITRKPKPNLNVNPTTEGGITPPKLDFDIDVRFGSGLPLPMESGTKDPDAVVFGDKRR